MRVLHLTPKALAVAAALALASAAAAQVTPQTDPNGQIDPDKTPPEKYGAPIKPRPMPLDKNATGSVDSPHGSVIAPQPGIDPNMTKPPPNPGPDSTPIIKPPPNGKNPSVPE